METHNNRLNLSEELQNLKIYQLKIINDLYQLRSVSKTAEKNFLTQPAISRILRKVEQQLGLKLFEGHSKGLKPTEFGIALSNRFSKILTEFRYAEDDINMLTNTEKGHLIIGTSISASIWVLPEAILKMKKEFPKIFFTIREGTNDVLIPELADGAIDLFIGRIPTTHSEQLDYFPLYTEGLCAICRKGHPLLKKKTVQLNNLADFQLIFPSENSHMRVMLEQEFKHHKVKPPINVIESLTLSTNLVLVQKSDAICFLPTLVAEQYTQASSLFIVSSLHLSVACNIGYSFNNQRPINPTLKKFLFFLKEVSKENNKPVEHGDDRPG